MNIEEFLKARETQQAPNMSMGPNMSVAPVKAIPTMSEKLKFAEANSEQVDEPIVSNIVNTYHPAAVGQQRLEAANAVMGQQRQPSNDRYAEMIQSSTVTTPPPMSAMQEYQGFLEKNNPQPTWTDAALGLVPVGIDALMGGHGAGLKVAADYYGGKIADKKKGDLTLQERLAAMQKSKYEQSLKTGKADGKLYQAQDENGKDIWMTREQAIGSGLISKDGKADTAGDRLKQQKALADRKFGMDIRKELIKDPTFAKARVRYASVNDAINVLNQKNPVADAGAPMIFAKGIFGEVGNLTAQEQAKFQGSPAYDRLWTRITEKMTNGTIGWEDRKDLLDLAEAMRDASKITMKDAAQQYLTGTKEGMGFDASLIVEPFLTYNDTPSIYNGAPKGKSGSPTKTNRAMNSAQNSPIIPKSTSEDAEYLEWRKSKYGH